jgi:hypothetical protein
MYAVYRRMSPTRKMKLVAAVVARQFHSAGHRLRHSAATDVDINKPWALMPTSSCGPQPLVERICSTASASS